MSAQPALGMHSERSVEPRLLTFLRCHPGLTCMLAGLLVVGLRLALLPLLPVPVPTVEDEFSYLLGADTFASGRLANPAHPMWVHFETIHVNPFPVYCSKYPPAEALFLAFGQKVFGHPWFGACLGMGVLFACLCWMLQGWLIAESAMLATLAGIFQFGVLTYWTTYWGGAVPAAGGALVLGAVPRLARRVALGPVLLACAGALVLANSRPYEGLLTAAGAAAVLLLLRRRAGQPCAGFLERRVLATVAAVVLCSGLAMGYYNYRLTGNPLLFPYMANQKMYAASPQLYISPPVPAPVYRHESIRRYWVEWDKGLYDRAAAHPLQAVASTWRTIDAYYLRNPAGLAACAGLLAGLPESLFAAALLVLPLAGEAVSKSFEAHYVAPVFGVLLLFCGMAFERAPRFRVKQFPAGAWLVVVFLGLSCAIWFGNLIDGAGMAALPAHGLGHRPELVRSLEARGGEHLIIVRYSPDHNVHEEWVYNGAAIDAAHVVWARDMGEANNRELFDYYPRRSLWLFEPDIDPLRLTPIRRP